MSRQKNSILINEHALNREPVPINVVSLRGLLVITGLPEVGQFARLRKKKRTHGGGKTRGLRLTNYVLSTCFIRFCLARVFFCTSPASLGRP